MTLESIPGPGRLSPMRLMRRFSIRLRMQGAIVLVLGLFTLVGAAALLGGRHLAALNTEFMAHSIQQTRAVGDIELALAEVRRHEKDMVIHYENGVQVLQYREAWAAALKRLQAGLAHLLDGAEDAVKPLASASLQEIEAYAKATSAVLEQVQNGAYDTAVVADKMLGLAKQHVHTVEQNLKAIHKIEVAEAQASQQAFHTTMRQTQWAFAVVLGLAMVLVTPLTLMNSRSITAPMAQARQLALAIAAGDLTQTVQVQGQDEAADLLRALAHMQTSLGGLVDDLRHAASSIQTVAGELASGNADLNGRTVQAAGQLRATAGSVQQLADGLQLNANAAHQASSLASSACTVAERGGAVVKRVVSTMDEINGSSRRIADIVGTIDGIAFQTNILALNAAVEAARAGDQGRGFAVVAAEVRSLAQRSAAAAREIKGLIETSVSRVNDGARLVRDAGQAMGDIVSSVRHVSTTIHGITNTSREQSDGIGQVNRAVGTLDQMTQQNAALVQQSTQAAERLQGQAQRLQQAVSRFQVPGGPRADTLQA